MNDPLLVPAPATSAAGPRAERMVYPENPRYRRIRSLSILMDQSIVLPTGYRIGLDPLLGLLPGVGDVICALISSYLVYQCARLGLRKRVLLRMVGNIALDAAVGAIPVLGDLFDAGWKANMRNLRLLDQHYHPAMPERSGGRVTGWLAALLGVMVLAAGTLCYFVVQVLFSILSFVFPALRR